MNEQLPVAVTYVLRLSIVRKPNSSLNLNLKVDPLLSQAANCFLYITLGLQHTSEIKPQAINSVSQPNIQFPQL